MVKTILRNFILYTFKSMSEMAEMTEMTEMTEIQVGNRVGNDGNLPNINQ